MKSVIIINFKSYEEGTGKRGFELARICEKISLDSGIEIIVCPPLVHLGQYADELSIAVFSQHVDAVVEGGYTGHVTPISVKESGGQGTLVNHSERRMLIADIERAVVECKKAGLATVICTNNVRVSKACASLAPTYIAIEPPELIGGDVPVTKAKPEVVRGAVEEIRSVNRDVDVLCGAGVKTGKDARRAIELGSSGVLVSSGVVRSKDPEKTLKDLVSGLSRE
ncbi:MAG: triose-phosphate isomerase [Thermoplasmata archaeon]